ncbi:MAG: UDP-N-acetylglucosamine 4,6-dehydratase (inverting) [Nitratireductor sp.]|nr:UDP-N-acetylglucosamine 4,6-dehydratase (inverting) [Nitratireductor sp.]
MLAGKSILITGGTGSFGKHFTRHILQAHPEINRLVIFSRDELKQFDMAQEFPRDRYPGVRFFLGDVRDADRLKRALEGINIVVHAAALKQVPAAEYNPFEFIKTNVLGAQNLIDACLDVGVEKVVALSTDKAAAPVNLYGATKLCSDKLFIAANNIVGARPLRFSVVRYGNVMGSRGSVIPFFLKMRKEGRLPITHPEMTRFSITLEDAIKMVFWSMENGLGGEIFVPKLPSYRITDLAEAIAPGCQQEIVGTRPGEKIHEEMIVPADAATTVDIGKYYAILPATRGIDMETYARHMPCTPVAPDFHYHSGNNEDFLGIDELRSLIHDHVDPEFSV